MFAVILQAGDSLAVAIPSFSDRFNFALPLIVVLLMVMFFLLLKVYTLEHPESERSVNAGHRKKIG
ncbi:MAG: hypothetical protein M1339_02100 [Bacteroidetes bacterium]|nr:hypothetical protein [Bacteroidota bacterium]